MEQDTISVQEINRRAEYRDAQEQAGTITSEVARIVEQLDNLGIHIDELRSRLGLVLAPVTDKGEVGGRLSDRSEPSQLAASLIDINDRIAVLREAVTSIHHRIDL